MKKRLLVPACLLALAVTAGASARPEARAADPGVTAGTVVPAADAV